MALKPDIAALLGRTQLFASLPASVRTLIAAEMRPAVYEAGHVLFSRGAPGEELFLVLAGRVRLSVGASEGRELSFLHAGIGEIFGEIAALDGGPRTADAKAVVRVSAMVLPRTALRALMVQHTAIADATIAFLCSRIRATNQVFEGVALHPIEVRLARLILKSAMDQKRSTDGNAVSLVLDMSQGELASLIGASRPKVNAALKTLELAGAVKREGEILDCDLAKLTGLAGGT